MNTYGDALMGSKRKANSKVVRMVLSPLLGQVKEKSAREERRDLTPVAPGIG